LAELTAQTADLIALHKTRWRKDVTLPGADRVLTNLTLERLEALQLVRRTAEGIQPLPAIARYALVEPEDETASGEPTLF
jgi:hypothetical protein